MNSMRMPGKVLGPSVVPWTADWRFDEERFRLQVAAQLDAGLSDLYIFGTAGEGYAVTDVQFLDIARAFSDQMRAGGAEPMVGVIGLSLGTMIERIAAAKKLGIRRFQISMPSWAALTDEEAQRFFEDVLGSFRDLEFLHYNVARAKRQLTGREYGELASRHPNLVATKQSTDSMNQIGESMALAPDLRHYFVDGGYAYGSLLGDCGLLPSISTCNHDRLQRFVDAGINRDVDQLLVMQRELRRVAAGLAEATGHRTLIDGAYDKVLWKLHDPAFPLRLLPPYAAAPDDAVERYRAWLHEWAPDWAPPDSALVGS
jgi:dihydrodipicolinate synthase/N-acetylneuraminate lyase